MSIHYGPGELSPSQHYLVQEFTRAFLRHLPIDATVLGHRHSTESIAKAMRVVGCIDPQVTPDAIRLALTALQDGFDLAFGSTREHP